MLRTGGHTPYTKLQCKVCLPCHAMADPAIWLLCDMMGGRHVNLRRVGVVKSSFAALLMAKSVLRDSLLTG